MMKSEAEAKASRVYEQVRATAYRDFYDDLATVGKLGVARAISHKSFREGVAAIGTPAPNSRLEPPSPFERALFRLYKRDVVAYQQSLVDARLPSATIIRRLAKHAEHFYQEL